MRKLSWLILSLMLPGALIYGQSLRAYQKAAEQAFDQKNYYAALNYYGVVMAAAEGEGKTWFQYAEAARLFNALPLAENYYDKVLQSNEAPNFPMSSYWLARVQQQLGKYKEAKNNFQKFLNSDPNYPSYAMEAKKAIEDCEWAEELSQAPRPGIIVSPLDDEINSPYAEFAPLQFGDTLFYSTLENRSGEAGEGLARPVSKIMFKHGYEEVESMVDFNKDRGMVGHSSLDFSGRRMYYTICAALISGDIPCRIFYKEKLADGHWGEEVMLPEHINLPGSTTTQPNLGRDADGHEVLYFVSDREGGMGGMDIWYSRVSDNGSFERPVNMTSANTPQDDITPFWQAQRGTIYFSSKGYPNMGGYDIYKMEVQNKKWSDPQHLGAPINSSYDDLYYSVNATGTEAYLTSNRDGSQYLDKSVSACCNDIFRVSIDPDQITARILLFDAETQLALPGATVSFKALPNQFLYARINKTGHDFSFDLGADKNYQFTASHPGYYLDTLLISTVDQTVLDTMEHVLYLKKKDKAALLQLKTLVFDATTKLPLLAATIEVLDIESATSKIQSDPTDHEFVFDVQSGKQYKIAIKRKDYYSEELTFQAAALKEKFTFLKKIYLEPEPEEMVTKLSLSEYLPLPVYFDNDVPRGGKNKSNTKVNYSDLVQPYYQRKREFASFYTRGLKGVEKLQAEQQIEDFFEHEVQRGNDNLQSFSTRLLLYLQQGNRAEIRIKAFASPLAEDQYNLQLTKRRISSLKNHFLYFQNGALRPYLNNEQLVISHQPFGETQAPESVADEYNDPKNAIYSIPASLERRVEIIEIK